MDDQSRDDRGSFGPCGAVAHHRPRLRQLRCAGLGPGSTPLRKCGFSTCPVGARGSVGRGTVYVQGGLDALRPVQGSHRVGAGQCPFGSRLASSCQARRTAKPQPASSRGQGSPGRSLAEPRAFACAKMTTVSSNGLLYARTPCLSRVEIEGHPYSPRWPCSPR